MVPDADRIFPTDDIDRALGGLIGLHGAEAICDSLAKFFRHDAALYAAFWKRQDLEHPPYTTTVLALLEGAAEHCQEAGMAYYCSTK